MRADRSLANDGLSSALLVVYLDSAQNLPVRRYRDAGALEWPLIFDFLSSSSPPEERLHGQPRLRELKREASVGSSLLREQYLRV